MDARVHPSARYKSRINGVFLNRLQGSFINRVCSSSWFGFKKERISNVTSTKSKFLLSLFNYNVTTVSYISQVFLIMSYFS